MSGGGNNRTAAVEKGNEQITEIRYREKVLYLIFLWPVKSKKNICG